MKSDIVVQDTRYGVGRLGVLGLIHVARIDFLEHMTVTILLRTTQRALSRASLYIRHVGICLIIGHPAYNTPASELEELVY